MGDEEQLHEAEANLGGFAALHQIQPTESDLFTFTKENKTHMDRGILY